MVSPCTLAERQGTEIRGQKPSKRGYLFGFGNTEESYRIMIYGTAARGLPTDGPFEALVAVLLIRGGRHPHYAPGGWSPSRSPILARRSGSPILMRHFSGNVAVPEASFDMVLHRHQLSAWSYT